MSQDLPQISVIVLAYKGAPFIAACLEALERSTGVTFETIVVDNASPDDAAAIVRRDFPQVKLICTDTNHGFAGGNNLGVAASCAPLLLLLNVDAMVQPDTLARLADLFATHLDVGIAGCKLLDPDGVTLQHAGGTIAPNGLTDHRGRGERDTNQYDTIVDVPYVTGAVLAVRRPIYERLGGLNAGYVPIYYEETELCLSAARHGFRVVYCPEAVAIHYEAGTTKAFSSGYYYKYHRNRWRFLLRNYSFVHLLMRSLPYEARWLAGIVVRPARRSELRPLLQAYGSCLLNMPAMLSGATCKEEPEMERILVTGAAGFMGSHLVDELVAHGHEVFGVDDLSGGFRRNIHSASCFTVLDLRDADVTAAYIESVQPTLIYHLAADATEGRSQFTPIECTQRNYVAYLNLLIPAIRSGLRKIVVTSSMSVYGGQTPPFTEEMERAPVDVYGIAKAAMERATEILSEVHGFTYTIVRPHNVYGPRQNIRDPYRNVVGIFINSLLNDRHFYIYGDGEQQRAFTYIDDFTPYMMAAGLSDVCDNQIVNLGPRQEWTINELSTVILSTYLRGALVPAHLRPHYLPDRPKEVKEAYCTVDKAERLLHYKTTVGLEEGVRRMIVWARELGPQQAHYLSNGLELTSGQVPQTWARQLI